MRRFKSAGQAQRFLSLHGVVQNLFRVGRHSVILKLACFVEFSHPPGSNRRPADHEAICVKSHLWIFFALRHPNKNFCTSFKTDDYSSRRMGRNLVLTKLLTRTELLHRVGRRMNSLDPAVESLTIIEDR
jgi:hypothetical protein